MRRAAAALAAALLVAAPAVTHACAVCVAGTERNRMAFFVTTIILSLLPLAIIALGAAWIWSRARAVLKDEFVDDDAWGPDAAPPAPERPHNA